MAGCGGRASGEERRPLANYHSALMHLIMLSTFFNWYTIPEVRLSEDRKLDHQPRFT